MKILFTILLLLPFTIFASEFKKCEKNNVMIQVISQTLESGNASPNVLNSIESILVGEYNNLSYKTLLDSKLSKKGSNLQLNLLFGERDFEDGDEGFSYLYEIQFNLKKSHECKVIVIDSKEIPIAG